jgi:hypothetical protein
LTNKPIAESGDTWSLHELNLLLGFIPKPSTRRMYDSGSIVPHIYSKLFTDEQMSQIKYIYYINNVSND